MLLIAVGAAAIVLRHGKIGVPASKRAGSAQNEKAGSVAVIAGLVVSRM